MHNKVHGIASSSDAGTSSPQHTWMVAVSPVSSSEMKGSLSPTCGKCHAAHNQPGAQLARSQQAPQQQIWRACVCLHMAAQPGLRPISCTTLNRSRSSAPHRPFPASQPACLHDHKLALALGHNLEEGLAGHVLLRSSREQRGAVYHRSRGQPRALLGRACGRRPSGAGQALGSVRKCG